jgi:hypothetical protein
MRDDQKFALLDPNLTVSKFGMLQLQTASLVGASWRRCSEWRWYDYSVRGYLLLKAFLAACFPLVLFVLGVLGTFHVNLLIYGSEAFDGDAGAGFAVLIEGVFMGLILAIGGIIVSVVLYKRFA